MPATQPLPSNLRPVREKALDALKEVQPAGPPRSNTEAKALFFASRTDAGRHLPEYYLVYFLLVDLLQYPSLGQWEKVAWSIPIRYKDRLYSIEHRKFGIGVFAPSHDPNARMSTNPSYDDEIDSAEIVCAIKKAISIATPYFEWLASEAASTHQINVTNKSTELYERYIYFRDQFRLLLDNANKQKDEARFKKWSLPNASDPTLEAATKTASRFEAICNAQAAIEAFFAWTEHLFIHIAILQGGLLTGEDVATLAKANWGDKFKAAIDMTPCKMKQHYDRLLSLRTQVRNFMAHGAFGKNGEAFEFHSGAGSVPILLSSQPKSRYAFTGGSIFDEETAIADIEAFVEYLWKGKYSPAKTYIFSGLPSTLTFAVDGSYKRAMQSDEEMMEFVEYLEHQVDRSANMDW